MTLILRQAAVDATVAQFRDTPIDWGYNDCIRVMFKHIENMGQPRKLRGLSGWTTEKGALRTFAYTKFKDLAEGVDSLGFERIAPLMMLPGDLIGFPGPDPWKFSISIYLGMNRALVQAFDHVIIANSNIAGTIPVAWRVDPCPR